MRAEAFACNYSTLPMNPLEINRAMLRSCHGWLLFRQAFLSASDNKPEICNKSASSHGRASTPLRSLELGGRGLLTKEIR